MSPKTLSKRRILSPPKYSLRTYVQTLPHRANDDNEDDGLRNLGLSEERRLMRQSCRAFVVLNCRVTRSSLCHVAILQRSLCRSISDPSEPNVLKIAVKGRPLIS